MEKTPSPRPTCPCCGKSIEKKPLGCTEPKHLAAWNKRQIYMKAYHKKWYAKNRAKKLAQNKAWDKANAETRNQYYREHALAWYHANKEHARAREKRYYEKNKRRINGRRNRVMKERRKRDPVTSIRYNARSRLSTFLRTAMPDRQFSISDLILGYTNEELRAHLEAQFLNAHIMSKVPRFGCWSFTRRTTNPSLIVRSILRDIPYYNDDRSNQFLRKPVDEMRNLIANDSDLGPALKDYEQPR